MLLRYYDPYQRLQLQFFCTPDDGCDGHQKIVESDFAVNKYLHTSASCWVLVIYSYDARNRECKIHHRIAVQVINNFKSVFRFDLNGLRV